MCRAVCYSGNRGQTNNEAGAWRQGFQFSLPTPPQPRAIPPAARFQLGASRGEWPLQPFPSRSGWGSREQKCQRETLLSFKGPPGWDGDFWKGKVESGDTGRGRYVPGMPGRQRITEDGSSKGTHPHSKSSCRRGAAGAAETGFLAPSRVAWAGSADLQNGIWTWHHLGIPRLPATREPGTGLLAFLTLYSWVRLGSNWPPREGVPHCFLVAAGQLSLRCRFFNCAGMLSCIGTSRGVAALTRCTIYLDLPWQQPHFVCPCIQTITSSCAHGRKVHFPVPFI